MRRCPAALLLSTLAAFPVAAQAFQGTVHMKMSGMGGADSQPMQVTYYLKNGQMAMEMAMPASAGPMAGQTMRMVYAAEANTMTMLIPMTADMAGRMGGMGAGMKGLKMVMNMNTVTPDSASFDGKVTRLGTSETIAGMSCDDYRVTSQSDTTMICVTQAIGHFVYPISGMGRGRAKSPAWAEVFGKNGFPLKVVSGGTSMEVTSVERGGVADSVFSIPSDYMDMSGMMGGMRGGRGGGY